jgi:hypothetical protein
MHIFSFQVTQRKNNKVTGKSLVYFCKTLPQNPPTSGSPAPIRFYKLLDLVSFNLLSFPSNNY